MGKKTPAQPAAPDPVATARAQSEFNIDAARLSQRGSMVDQATPQGSLTYQDLGNDRYRAVTSYSPEQQRLYDLSTQAQTTYGQAANDQLNRARDGLSSPFQFNAPAMSYGGPDRSGSVVTNVADRNPEMQRAVQDRTQGMQYRPDYTGLGNPDQSREAVQGALLSRINPDLERERAGLENRLASQGITMGSEAWNTGMQDYGRQANDARYGAIMNAGQEQSRMVGLGLQQAGFGNDARGQAQQMDLARAGFANDTTQQLNANDMSRAGFQNQAVQQLYGMDMGRAQFGNQARQQSLQEQLALRAQPVNEASALLSGSQVQMPQFQQTPGMQVAAPDYQGAVGQNYAGQVSNWNARAQMIGAQNAATAQAIGQIGGMGAQAAMKFSDRRLKKNVARIGTANGLPVYRFDYLWDEPAVGYMADEVARVAPHAVAYGADGYARVNYATL